MWILFLLGVYFIVLNIRLEKVLCSFVLLFLSCIVGVVFRLMWWLCLVDRVWVLLWMLVRRVFIVIGLLLLGYLVVFSLVSRSRLLSRFCMCLVCCCICCRVCS